jgi:hypothetical protein
MKASGKTLRAKRSSLKTAIAVNAVAAVSSFPSNFVYAQKETIVTRRGDLHQYGTFRRKSIERLIH